MTNKEKQEYIENKYPQYKESWINRFNDVKEILITGKGYFEDYIERIYHLEKYFEEKYPDKYLDPLNLEKFPPRS